jgi:hypothetical protein
METVCEGERDQNSLSLGKCSSSRLSFESTELDEMSGPISLAPTSPNGFDSSHSMSSAGRR